MSAIIYFLHQHLNHAQLVIQYSIIFASKCLLRSNENLPIGEILSWMLNLKVLNFQSRLWRQRIANFYLLLQAHVNCESFVRVCSALLLFNPNIFFMLLTTRRTVTVHVLPMIAIANLVITMKNIKININRHNRLELPKILARIYLLLLHISRLYSKVFRKLSAIFAWIIEKPYKNYLLSWPAPESLNSI